MSVALEFVIVDHRVPLAALQRFVVARIRRAIAKQLGVGVGTLYRFAPERSKTREKVFGTR